MPARTERYRFALAGIEDVNAIRKTLLADNVPRHDPRDVTCWYGSTLMGRLRDLVVVGYTRRPVILEARVDGANDGVPAPLG